MSNSKQQQPLAHQNVDLDLLFKNSKDRKRNDKSLVQSDERVVNCLRCLAMDAVQQANSGHPGTPMAMAPVAYALWARFLRYDPLDPSWANRDRFILSMGHASMLLYGLLHLAGVREVGEDGKVKKDEFAVPLDDIKRFRQLDSKCPGHPEYGYTTGVEATTGPLGQGVASSVGMAIASKWKAAKYNRPGYENLFDFDVYALAGDGCLMEGISQEAASLAGHMKLDNLCWIWDNNQITIEGNTSWSISEDIPTRFLAYGWNVLRVGDANDVTALSRAINVFKREKQRPTLIVVDSHIAWGAPTKQDSFTAHGAPLGKDEVSATKAIYGWPDEMFHVPEDVKEHFQGQLAHRGGEQRKKWDEEFVFYKNRYPVEAAEVEHILNGTLPADWDSFCKEFPASDKGLATRQSSSEVLNMVAKGIPWLLGGSADLGTSCLTTLKFAGVDHFMTPDSTWGNYSGRIFHFGIREHAMGAALNGMALSKLRPFGSTFLVFLDYMKPPVRMSSIMECGSIWIFTHDSIGVGEDGPTHQPIEQLISLRSIPGLLTFRPCDANETLEMWKYSLPLQKQPVAFVLSRQPVPTLCRTKYGSAKGLRRGAYKIAGKDTEPDLILMASGSEVALMLQAHEHLDAEGTKVWSISVPCIELFKQQSEEYRNKLLPPACRARVSIEAATRESWDRFLGLDGEHVGMITFGASAPIKCLHKSLGFTKEAVLEACQRVMNKKPRTATSEMDVIRAWKRQKTETQ